MSFCRYPPDRHPVLAFKGAPATFPVPGHHRYLQRYVQWSSKVNRVVEDYITQEMKDSPFIGVHMRIGIDWVRLSGVGGCMCVCVCVIIDWT